MTSSRDPDGAGLVKQTEAENLPDGIDPSVQVMNQYQKSIRIPRAELSNSPWEQTIQLASYNKSVQLEREQAKGIMVRRERLSFEKYVELGSISGDIDGICSMNCSRLRLFSINPQSLKRARVCMVDRVFI